MTMPLTSFNGLVEHYLGQRLPPAMADTIKLPDLSSDARAFIRRMLGLMKSARFPATDFNPFLIRMLATMVPGVLPCSWGGRIPPLTVPGRHRKLDVYIAAHDWPSATPPVFVDLGCGFPPVTTVDTAGALPYWRIFGVDRSFAPYVVYDSEGHYACFDAEGRYQYFQSMTTRSGLAMYADPEATRKHFEDLFEALAPQLPKPGNGMAQTAAWNGNRLIHNQISEFESANLTFLESEIEALTLPPVQAARCMNVLVYFTPPVQKEMLRKTGSLLGKDGMMIAGTSGFGIDARYTVYRQKNGDLIPSEFAFSFENLRSLGVCRVDRRCGRETAAQIDKDRRRVRMGITLGRDVGIELAVTAWHREGWDAAAPGAGQNTGHHGGQHTDLEQIEVGGRKAGCRHQAQHAPNEGLGVA